MEKTLRCRRGGLALSTTLRLHREVVSQSDGQPYVDPGALLVSDGGFFTGTAGRYMINLADARNMQLHPDTRRRNGCCGLDGLDGPNRICACGAEVATEKSDCWMPHALIFERNAIELADIEEADQHGEGPGDAGHR